MRWSGLWLKRQARNDHPEKITVRANLIARLSSRLSAAPFRQRNQLGQGLDLQLLHHLEPMRLDGSLGAVQRAANGLVGVAANDEVKYLSLARLTAAVACTHSMPASSSSTGSLSNGSGAWPGPSHAEISADGIALLGRCGMMVPALTINPPLKFRSRKIPSFCFGFKRLG